jgi:oligopeptide transport system substrate-binding protein
MRRLPVVLSVLALLLTLAGPLVRGVVAQGSGSKVLRIRQGEYPDLIDPQKGSYTSELVVLAMAYEGLTRLDEHMNTVPAAAQSWEFSADGTTLTFHLRPGLTYSDGSPLTAERFRYAVERTCDPHTAAQYQSILFDVVGCQAFARSLLATPAAGDQTAVYNQAKAALGVSAPDDRTLVIHLTHPAPYFPTIAFTWVFYPVKHEIVQKDPDGWWRDPANHVGNGPFRITRIADDQEIDFVANDHYWGGRPRLDGLDYVFIKDSTVALEAYRAGQVDITGVDGEQLPAVAADPALSKELLRYPIAGTNNLDFNLTKPPFEDKHVREAFAYAFDRQTWCDTVNHGTCVPAYSWVPPGTPGHIDDIAYAFDPAKAKAALAASRYGGPDKLPPITYTYPSDDPAERDRAEWIAGQYRDVLGVTITLDPVDNTTLEGLTKAPATFPQMLLFGWTQDYPDPQDWLSIYWVCGATNYAVLAGYCDPDFDQLIKHADAELDPAKRMTLYEQAGRVLQQDAPAVFAFNPAGVFLVKPNVTGYVATAGDFNWPGAWASPLTINIAPAVGAPSPAT